MYIFKKINLLNLLVAIIPLSYIIGNLAINLNIILIIIIGLLIYKKNIFYIENKIYQYLIYSFFLYLILITSINNISNIELNSIFKENLFKSIFFLRFIFLFLIINKLIETNDLNIKLFYVFSAFFSFLLAVDIIVQLIFGKDLIGYEITFGRPSGFFGEETIAGGFLQKFILFFIFLIIFKIKKFNTFFLSVLFLLMFIPIFLTGNRMPTLLYVFSIVLYFLFEKKIKELFLFCFILISLLFLTLNTFNNSKFYKHISNFYYDTIDIVKISPKLFYYNSYNGERIELGKTGYLIHFNSGIQTWKQKKIFGAGLKSFPLNCSYSKNQTCNTHPHNYFIEIMIDMGLIGLILIYLFFFISVKNYIKFYFSKEAQKEKYLTFPFFVIIFLEFFPFRSSGSFFTTGNSLIIFTLLAFFVNSSKITKLFSDYNK